MQVRDLMTTDVVTAPLSGTLQDAAERLLERGVGSVIVVDGEQTPVGILTESDVIEAAYRTEHPLGEIEVREVGHRPVATAEPDDSVRRVAERMAEEDIKKMPVLEELDIVGIVTLTDVVWHLSEIRKEASELERAAERWDPTG